MSDQDDHGVGYGKPPRSSQFQKGQSGNPAGRPKAASDSKSALQKALNEKIPIQESGEHKTITAREAVAKLVVRQALKGDLRAGCKVLDPKFTGDEPTPNDSAALSKTDEEVVKAFVERIRRALEQGPPESQGGDNDQRKP